MRNLPASLKEAPPSRRQFVKTAGALFGLSALDSSSPLF